MARVMCDWYRKSPYFNPAYDTTPGDHLPPMFPHPSPNPIVRFLDWLCHDMRMLNMSPWSVMVAFTFWGLLVAPLFVILYGVFTGADSLEFKAHLFKICGLDPAEFAIIFVLPLAILSPDAIYRRFRIRYFRKHLLPGPYGWGNLEKVHPMYYD